MSASSETEDLELNEEQSSDDEEFASGEEGVDNVTEEETDDEMTVCDDGTHIDSEESGAEEPDVNASATESDEDDDDEVDDDEDVPTTKQNVKAPTPKVIAKITDAVKERHEKRKGRQLYIRFPEKLPESMEDFQKKVKSLSDLIVEGVKPRQKHARFCLVDFATTEDRDKTLQELSKNDSKMVVSLPKTDSEDFLKTLVDKKIKQSEKKRAKNLLRRQSKKHVMEKTFTSILLVLNLPSSASTAQIKGLFPDAVDIQTKGATGKYTGKMIATVTLPSTEDAKVNVKRKLELGGNKLIVRFNTESKRKNKNASKNGKPAAVSKKGPIAPANLEGSSPKKSPKKRSLSENGNDNVSEKKPKPGGGKGKGKKQFPPNKKTNPGPNGRPGGNKNKQKKGKAVPVPAE